MHSYGWAILPTELESGRDLKAEVGKIFYGEPSGSADDTYDDAPEKWFDIGGAFTGLIDDPNPRTLPHNYDSPCSLCGGSGTRTGTNADGDEVTGPCPWCDGIGYNLKLNAAEWIPEPVDIRSITTFDPASVITPAEICTPHEWIFMGRSSEDEWLEQVQATLAKYPHGIVVVIDVRC